jgi:hypothetical protein
MIQIPLTPEEFQTKATKLAEEQGIEISGPSGTLEKMGVKAGYLYENGLLSITILQKPAFLSEDACEKAIRTWL